MGTPRSLKSAGRRRPRGELRSAHDVEAGSDRDSSALSADESKLEAKSDGGSESSGSESSADDGDGDDDNKAQKLSRVRKTSSVQHRSQQYG